VALCARVCLVVWDDEPFRCGERGGQHGGLGRRCGLG
jgi:hypothetical protein